MGQQKDIADELERVADITPARKKLLSDAAAEIRRQRGVSAHYSALLKAEIKKSLDLEAQVGELVEKIKNNREKFSKKTDKSK